MVYLLAALLSLDFRDNQKYESVLGLSNWQGNKELGAAYITTSILRG
jgi:hypothetical protein